MGISSYMLSVLCGKTVVVMIVLLGLYRLLGKRNLAQFTVFDLVTILAVANSVQNAMTAGKGNLMVGIVCSSTLLLLAFAISKLFTRSLIAERLLLGVPVPLVSSGHLLKENLRRESVTYEELQQAFRQHDLLEPSQVDLAVLEIDGSITVIPKGTASRIDSKFV
jgi:uncharacterized membrane protein YcaP (DUF421 family)